MGDSSKQVIVRDDDVEVERTIEDRSTATVVVYRLKTLAGTPAVVHVEEAIPPDDRIETAEFHPSHVPDDWSIGDGAVQFDASVPPDETRMFVLGIDATDDEPLGQDEPTVTQPDIETTTIPEANDAGPSTPGDTQTSPDEDASTVTDLGEQPVSDGGEAAADAADISESLTDSDDSAEDLGLAEADTVEESTNAETPADAEIIDASTGDPIGEEFSVDDESDADIGLQNGPEKDTHPSEDEASLVGDLLTELQSGNATDEEREALRTELGVARSDEVRFRHVQSRMDDFEAYVEALEGIIDRHGTASEFVDGIERQVTDIHDELSAVRSEVTAVEDDLETATDDHETLADEVADLDETVTAVTDDVDELHELVETVDDRTTTIEEELREELDAVRDERADALERIETEHEEAREQLEDEFEAELESLREDVDSFDNVRRTLLDAFGSGLDPTSDEDTDGDEDGE